MQSHMIFPVLTVALQQSLCIIPTCVWFLLLPFPSPRLFVLHCCTLTSLFILTLPNYLFSDYSLVSDYDLTSSLFFEITLHKSNGWLDSSLSVLPFSSTLGLSWATTYILVISSNISKYAPHPWRKENDYLCFIFSPPKNLCLILRSLIEYMNR